MATVEAMLTMLPPSDMAGMACLEQRKTLFRLTAMISSQSGPAMVTTVPRLPRPALLTRMSRRPKRSVAASTIALTSASSLALTRTGIAAAPRAAAIAPAAAPFTSATTTFAPSRTKAAAVAAPISAPAPVTIATLFCNHVTHVSFQARVDPKVNAPEGPGRPDTVALGRHREADKAIRASAMLAAEEGRDMRDEAGRVDAWLEMAALRHNEPSPRHGRKPIAVPDRDDAVVDGCNDQGRALDELDLDRAVIIEQHL